LTGAFGAIPVVTGGELIISRLVFTRLVLISAHTKKIDANRHMMAKKPAWTLAAASGRLFISVHGPHSIKVLRVNISGAFRLQPPFIRALIHVNIL
jgi:hypothetical protein